MTFTVPGYQVGELLGYGSHGEVWRGQVTGGGTPVALKRIAVRDNSTARAARSEAALLSALSHPNLIGLREFLILDAAMVLVLELADGGSLADLLRRRDLLTPAEVAASLSPIAAALAHAHDEGVLHGDLSASNVLFTAAGQPKLADLGVARLFGATDAAIGTPAYVDPVVAAGGAAGAASDVFSLAAVALHALTGRGPWQRQDDDSVEQVLAVAATGVIEELPSRLSSCPPRMAAVVMRGLDPEPHRRGTAAEFALDLRAATHDAPVVLSAGRTSRHSVGRHATNRQAAEQRPAADRTGTPNRPAFARPELVATDRVPADLTHISRPQVRASTPPVTDGRAGVTRLVRLRSVRLISAALALAIGGVSVALSGLVPLRGDDAQAARTARAAQSQPPLTAADLLATLDTVRSRAFAQRQPQLLTQVYTAPALLAEDAAQLRTRVPTGCQLAGLATSYRDVVVLRQSASRIDLQATATLTAGDLRCGGASRGHTAASGPTAVRLTLTARADGSFGIASLQVV